MTKERQLFTTLVVPLLAEFVTQFIHTLWGVMSSGPDTSITESSKRANDSSDCKQDTYFTHVFVPAFQSGLSVWMQIVLFWKISVVHFNPAISVGFLLTGQLAKLLILPYIFVQCLASVAAAFVAKLIFGANPSAIIVPDEASSLSIFLNEVLMTGILVFFAVTMVVDKTYDQATGPLAIGLTVFQGILSAKWVGVVCLSPSRAFGPALITGGAAWNRHWLLWISDLTGGALAAVLYMFFFAPPQNSWRKFLMKKFSKVRNGTGIQTKDNKERVAMVQQQEPSEI